MQGRSLRMSLLLASTLLALLGTLTACTKSEGPSGTTSSASAATASATSATATAPTTAASAAPDASPLAADTTTGNTPTAGADAETPTTASATASASAPKPSGSADGGALAAANAACGTKPQPDCPLQSWMKKNTNPAIAAADLPALATALDQTATFAPPGYTNWVSISKDGAKAAKAGDMAAAKASCRTCHDQYKTKYKAELRGRKI